MTTDKNENRIRIIRGFLLLNGAFLLFWWPLSHWFYPDFYHQLLGFVPGTYQDSMVKVIGTCGILPVLICFSATRNPIRNKDSVAILIVFGILISSTFSFLVLKGYFPVREFANVGLSLFSALFLLLAYPWKMAAETILDGSK